MSPFVVNPADFSAECQRRGGRCAIVRENFLFLDNGDELAAVECLNGKCGYVVLIPDQSGNGNAVLYHTSCQRMTDVVGQIFQDHLEPPASLGQAAPEMALGELYRRGVTIAYDRCRAQVDSFGFPVQMHS